MTLFEWTARLWKPAMFSGVITDLTEGDPIRMIVGMDNDQAQLWCVPRGTWPNGPVSIFMFSNVAIAQAEVLGHADIDYAVYDTDTVLVDGSPYNLPASIWVSKLSVGGTAKTYVWTGEYTNGKVRRTVQFALSQVKAIRRLER